MSEFSERFKLALHTRIKKGTIEVDTPKGKVLMKYGGTFFKGYRIIHPSVIEENGKLKFIPINFICNGWANLFKLLGTIAIFAFVFWSYNGVISQFNVIQNSTCVQNCLNNIPKIINPLG